MYSNIPQFVLGFHGCDKTFAESILASSTNILQKSVNSYDWLGSGVYFWENNPQRAIDYANELAQLKIKNRPTITNPYGIGAVIDLGNCFNLLNSKYIEYLRLGYELFKSAAEVEGKELPTNKNVKGNNDKLLRHLDCAVIDFTLKYLENENGLFFDSVRGLFLEGNDIYPEAGFQDKNHIQICIRNTNCIKGFFRILE